MPILDLKTRLNVEWTASSKINSPVCLFWDLKTLSKAIWTFSSNTLVSFFWDWSEFHKCLQNTYFSNGICFLSIKPHYWLLMFIALACSLSLFVYVCLIIFSTWFSSSSTFHRKASQNSSFFHISNRSLIGLRVSCELYNFMVRPSIDLSVDLRTLLWTVCIDMVQARLTVYSWYPSTNSY